MLTFQMSWGCIVTRLTAPAHLFSVRFNNLHLFHFGIWKSDSNQQQFLSICKFSLSSSKHAMQQ